jgi:hypothetical protein
MPTKQSRKRPAKRLLVKVPNLLAVVPHGKKYAPKDLHIATRSALWWDKGMRYVRAYFELLDLYMVRRRAHGDPEGLPPLIGAEHVGLWLKLVRLQQRGRLFTLEELAGELTISLHTLRAWLNRLADVKLIHFERCYFQGRPIDIVLHTPLRASQLTIQVHAELLQRCGKGKRPGYTEQMRKKLGQDWPGRWREGQDLMPGTERQRRTILNLVYYLCYVEMEQTGEPWQVTYWLREFEKLCGIAKVNIDERHKRAAMVLRKQFLEGEFTDEEFQKADKILKRSAR